MIIFLSKYKIRRTTFIIDFLISLLKKVYVIEMGPIFDCSQFKFKWISPASPWNSCTVITLALGHLPQNFIIGSYVNLPFLERSATLQFDTSLLLWGDLQFNENQVKYTANQVVCALVCKYESLVIFRDFIWIREILQISSPD